MIFFNYFKNRDSQSNQSAGKQYSIIAIPRISLACKSFLKEKKMTNKFAMISEFPLTIVPVECDVLSMEDSQCFAVCLCICFTISNDYIFHLELLHFRTSGWCLSICTRFDAISVNFWSVPKNLC